MPTYTFKNKKTGKQWDDIMSISDKEAYLEANPHIQQLIVKPLSMGDPVRVGRKKPDDGFRDVLREIKKKHPRGGGINTF